MTEIHVLCQKCFNQLIVYKYRSEERYLPIDTSQTVVSCAFVIFISTMIVKLEITPTEINIAVFSLYVSGNEIAKSIATTRRDVVKMILPGGIPWNNGKLQYSH